MGIFSGTRRIGALQEEVTRITGEATELDTIPELEEERKNKEAVHHDLSKSIEDLMNTDWGVSIDMEPLKTVNYEEKNIKELKMMLGKVKAEFRKGVSQAFERITCESIEEEDLDKQKIMLAKAEKEHQELSKKLYALTTVEQSKEATLPALREKEVKVTNMTKWLVRVSGKEVKPAPIPELTKQVSELEEEIENYRSEIQRLSGKPSKLNTLPDLDAKLSQVEKNIDNLQTEIMQMTEQVCKIPVLPLLDKKIYELKKEHANIVAEIERISGKPLEGKFSLIELEEERAKACEEMWAAMKGICTGKRHDEEGVGVQKYLELGVCKSKSEAIIRMKSAFPLKTMRQETVSPDLVARMLGGKNKGDETQSIMQKQEVTKSESRGKCTICEGFGIVDVENKDDGEENMDSLIYGRIWVPDFNETREEICGVCCGTCHINEVLGRFKSKFVGGQEIDSDDEDVGDESYPCNICFGKSECRISNSCDHYYCTECIRRTLNMILEVAQFPAYCPTCKAEKNDKPEVGLITSQAMSFLQHRGVISKELQFRFLKQAKEGAGKEYFACPADGCDEFLVHQESRWRTFKDDKGLDVLERKPGRCKCGGLVCLHCHQSVSQSELHECPDENKAEEMDEATKALISSLSKKCPKCGVFIQKNDGCNSMMCGTKAHGKLRDALRNGGCGHQFTWSNLQPLKAYYTNLEGKGITEFTGDMRHLLPTLWKMIEKEQHAL